MHLFVLWSFVAVLAPLFVLAIVKAAVGMISHASPTIPPETPTSRNAMKTTR